MYYRKKGTMLGFRFKSNHRPLYIGPAKKRVKRPAPVVVNEEPAIGPEVIKSFSELIGAVSPELALEVLKNGLPKQIFIGPYLFHVLKPIFQEYPIRIVKHRWLANRDVKLSWDENQFVPTKKIK